MVIQIKSLPAVGRLSGFFKAAVVKAKQKACMDYAFSIQFPCRHPEQKIVKQII